MKQSSQLQRLLNKIPKIFQDLDFKNLKQGQDAVAQLAQSISQIGNDLSKMQDSSFIKKVIDQTEQVSDILKTIHPQLSDATKQASSFAKQLLRAAVAARTLQQRLSNVVSEQLTDWLDDVRRRIQRLPFGKIVAQYSQIDKIQGKVSKGLQQYLSNKQSVGLLNTALVGIRITMDEM